VSICRSHLLARSSKTWTKLNIVSLPQAGEDEVTRRAHHVIGADISWSSHPPHDHGWCVADVRALAAAVTLQSMTLYFSASPPVHPRFYHFNDLVFSRPDGAFPALYLLAASSLNVYLPRAPPYAHSAIERHHRR
jgi:hypothetical protein